MSNILTPPQPIFADIDGSPLNEGFIFIGQSTKEPAQYPINAYWDAEKTQLATQPIRTKNGYIVNNGIKATIYVEENSCSVLVSNKFQTEIAKTFSLKLFSSNENTTAAIQVEKDRALAAESSLNAAITAETNRATTSETNLNTSINTERSRALAAEAVLQTNINAVGVGNKAYLTYADMNADKANIPNNSKVTVTNDSTSSNNGDWQYSTAGGGTFTKSVYDPVTTAKNYTDAEVPKPSQFNGWFDPSFELLDLTNKNYFGRERMWNGFGGWTKVLNQFYGGKAMRKADGYNTTTLSGFVTYLDELGVTTGDTITTYVLCTGNASSVYAVGRFTTASGTVVGGDQLLVNSAGTNPLVTSLTTPRWLRLTTTVPAGGVDRFVVYPYNLAGATVGFDVIGHWVCVGNQSAVSSNPAYRNTLPTLRYNDLNTKTAAAFDAYINSKHLTEKVGNGTYSLIKTGGFYETIEKSGYVNTAQCRIWKTTPSDIEVRVYVRSAADSLAFTPSAITPNASFTITSANFPTTEKDFNIRFPSDIYVNAGERLFILFRAVDGGSLFNKIWFYDPAILPARHGFAYSPVSDWTVAFSMTSAPAGYGAASVAFYRATGEFDLKSDALNIRYGATNVDAALKSIEAALPSTTPPSVILPPKIYAVQNKEANVYFDNLVISPVDDYLVDVSASVGVQQRERFTINSSTTSTATATISLFDKKSGSQVATASTSLQVVASSAKSGTTPKLSVIGDSLVAANAITQTVIDVAATDVMGVQLVGTLGTGSNKHEGRGGWGIANYTTAGPTYYAFTVSGVVVEPLINATEYTNNGTTFRVQSVSLTGGAGTIVCSVQSGTNPPTASGTLTKSNAVAGDATIAFSASTAQAGNPFWFSGAVDYPQYLTANGLATPDFVAIMLGINDVFGQASDTGATSIATTRLNQLDTLITSIKAVNGTIKVLLCIPTPPANQDAFGKNYLVGDTSWRHKRNMLLWAQSMITKYSGQEANRIYLVPTNVALDTVNNYPTETVAVNSRNATTVVRQSNGVHPATSGYQQIGDAIFYAVKAI